MAHVFDACILPVLTYGIRIMTVGKSVEKLRVTQQLIERSMLGVSLRDRIRNTMKTIKVKIEIVDVIERTKNKMEWGVATLQENPQINGPLELYIGDHN